MPVRGNIDTRLRKLREGDFDALILAAAGLKRANLFDSAVMAPIEITEMVPSPGQGALALQCRSADSVTLAILKQLNDPITADCVALERKIVHLLNADCHSPLGVHARMIGGEIQVFAALGRENVQSELRTAFACGSLTDADALAEKIAADLWNDRK
jgi:hydroxymethylbilane synthase